MEIPVEDIIANGIQDVIDGSRMKSADVTSTGMKTWMRDNAKAMFLISSAMEYMRLESLLVCPTAKEM